ncbi:MAG: endonuclease/exonuclease/phosphatase family protein [Planctomycetota bacterium]
MRPSGLLVAAGTALVSLSLIGYLDRFYWAAELAAHFRVQYALGLLFIGLALMLARRRRPAAVFTVVSVTQLASIVPLYLPHPADVPEDAPRFRIYMHNVHASNPAKQEVLQAIRAANPDVIVLLEVNDDWMRALKPLLEGAYEFSVTQPRSDDFGLALLSRLPLERSETLFLGEAGVPSIRVRARLGERSVTILASHTVPPMGAARAALRDGQLAAIAATASTISGPLVVVGDLNCTHFSARFRDLLRVGGLEDSARGRGFQPTWPAPWLPVMLPLDHCLLRGGLAVRRRRTRAACGSDHLSLVVDLVLLDE